MPTIEGETLRGWRRSLGWDVTTTARHLRHAARETGQAVAAPHALVKMIRGWERGDHELSERYELLYRAIGFVPPAALDTGNVDEEEDRVRRREFGIAAMGLLVGTLAKPARIPSTVSATQVHDLRLLADNMWTRDWTVGGTALLDEATRHYAAVRSMLDLSAYSGTVGSELQELAADLAASAGFIAFDAGDQRLARGLFGESALLTGNDPLLTAHTYALLALQSTSLATLTLDRGLAREALRFLGYAADAARHEPSPRLHATIAMRRATASALLDDDVAVRRYIAAARRELDRGDHPADPHWASFVTESEVTAHEAMARLSQGKAELAVRLFRDVLADPDLPPRNRALYQARLAMSLHADGDHAEAFAEGLRVLATLQGPVKSARTLHQLRPVRESAPPGNEFAARFDAALAS